MRKQSWLLLNLLLLLLLTGCALIEGEEGEHRERLDPADWPTPPPAVTEVTPTPFPKVTLAPTPEAQAETEAQMDPAEAAELLQQLDTESDMTALLEQLGDDEQAAALLQQMGGPEKAAALLQQLGASGQADELIQQLSAGGDLSALLESSDVAALVEQAPAAAGLGSLTPLAVLKIQSPTTTLRQQPDPAATALDEMEEGDLAGVLGRDAAGAWLFVITIDNLKGWIPLDSARVVGDLSGVPVLPPGILATLSRPAANASTEAPAAAAAAPAAPAPPLDLDSLKPVGTAKVNISLLNMRQRPGPDYPVVDTIAQDEELQVLALNERKDWVLVTTADQTNGWVSRQYLVSSVLDKAPQVKTVEPTSGQAADQSAPVVPVSVPAGAEQGSSASQATSAGAPAAVPVASQETGLALPGNTLASIATANVNEKVEGRRGAGDNYGAVTTFTVDEPVTVHGTNETGDWVIIQGPSGRIGWVPLSTLDLSGSLSGATPVVTAWVDSNETEVKTGPGIYYETSGVLAINNMISLLALNEGRSWALVETFAGGRGWVPLRFLQITGSLSKLPEIAAPPVAEGPSKPVFPSEPPPLTGKLVFQTSSGGDIMIINADGSGLRRLTSGIDPVLSPDGQQVAFTRWEGDVGTLWTINVDGSDERAVLGEMRKAKGPEWSPDGAQIILNFQHGGYVDARQDCVGLEPGSFPRLPRNATDVKVIVDGKGNFKLCFTLPPDPHWGLRLINLSDGSFQDLYGGLYAFRPAWDPAQPWRVVSDAGNGLLAIDINRDDYRQYLTEELLDGSPTFSPDGRFIATATANQGGYDLYRLNADGGGRIRLTETPIWVPIQPESEGEVWHNVSPTWSPDSAQIAFLTNREGRWEIWLMGADGSNQRPMFPPEVNKELNIEYNFVDERVLSWR